MKTQSKIGTIEQEEKLCRDAWAKYPNATWAWCCHHGLHCEPLTEPAENRIAYIKSNKSKSEQARRFRNFRPVLDNLAVKPAREAYDIAVKTARKAYDIAVQTANKPLQKLHTMEWPDNTWNGTSVFGQ